jgi:hypothetical protein
MVASNSAYTASRNLIHLVVRQQHRASQRFVSIDECVQALEQHGLHQRRHLGNVDHGLDQRMVHQGERTLGDVLGQIADALQIGVDLERGGEETQIAWPPAAERQQARHHAVDLHFHAVDFRLVANHLLGQFPVLIHQGTDAAAEWRIPPARPSPTTC